MHAMSLFQASATILGCLLQLRRSSSIIPIALAEVPDKKEARDAI